MYTPDRSWSTAGIVLMVIGAFILLAALVGGGCYAIPQYNVWHQGLSGKAELAKAEWNRQVVIVPH